jgi:Protein of unknown function (DUF2804)
MARSSLLPPSPRVVEDAGGAPRFGTFQGSLDVVDLSKLRGSHQPSRLGRLRTHKKWLYTFVATPEVAVLSAIVDLNYTSNAFILAFDYTSGRVLTDVGVLGLPRPLVGVNGHPAAGTKAEFRRPDFRARVWRDHGDDSFHGRARVGLRKPKLELTWDLHTVGGPPPMTLIAPVAGGGVVNVSQKWAGLAASGLLEVDGRRYALDGGVGGMDYTNGYLARETSWRWAFVNGRLDDGTPFGINLVEGFNESGESVNENALWLGEELIPLGRARFTWNPSEVLDPWQVRTADGVLDLHFKPVAAHQELRDLKVVKSSFKQPVGLWEGEVRLGDRSFGFRDAPGVAEDQTVLW